MNKCVDCKTDISHKRSDAERCNSCREKHRKVWFKNYRKTEARRRTIKKDNDSEKGRERKKRYNKSLKGKEKHKEYRQSEKGKSSSRAQVITRRMKLKDGSKLSSKDIRELKKRYPLCVYCGSKENLEIEHINPVSKKTSILLNQLPNLTMACRKCNIEKGNMSLQEYSKKYPKKFKNLCENVFS